MVDDTLRDSVAKMLYYAKLRDAVAKMLYREMKECCNGYVEYIPDEDPIGECGVTFDGDIAIDALADAVIEAFRTNFAPPTD